MIGWKSTTIGLPCSRCVASALLYIQVNGTIVLIGRQSDRNQNLYQVPPPPPNYHPNQYVYAGPIFFRAYDSRSLLIQNKGQN